MKRATIEYSEAICTTGRTQENRASAFSGKSYELTIRVLLNIRTDVIVQLRSPRTVFMLNTPQAPYYAKHYCCYIIYIMLNINFENEGGLFNLLLFLSYLLLVHLVYQGWHLSCHPFLTDRR